MLTLFSKTLALRQQHEKIYKAATDLSGPIASRSNRGVLEKDGETAVYFFQTEHMFLLTYENYEITKLSLSEAHCCLKECNSVLFLKNAFFVRIITIR